MHSIFDNFILGAIFLSLLHRHKQPPRHRIDIMKMVNTHVERTNAQSFHFNVMVNEEETEGEVGKRPQSYHQMSHYELYHCSRSITLHSNVPQNGRGCDFSQEGKIQYELWLNELKKTKWMMKKKKWKMKHKSRWNNPDPNQHSVCSIQVKRTQ